MGEQERMGGQEREGEGKGERHEGMIESKNDGQKGSSRWRTDEI